MEKSTDLQTLAVYGIPANKNGPIGQTKGFGLYVRTGRAQRKDAKISQKRRKGRILSLFEMLFFAVFLYPFAPLR